MGKKLKIFVVFSCLFLTMCRTYAQSGSFSTVEGLTCQSYTAYFQDGLNSSRGVECYYECPDRTVGPLDFEVDPGLSATKGDLDRMFCGIEPEFTPTSSSSSASPTVEGSPSPEASPAADASPSPTASPVAEASATTGAIPQTGQESLLTGRVTMCDTGGNLISFRLTQPPPDLSGMRLTAQIGQQESTCYVNPTNPSLMTCTLPPGVTFPAQVVVNVNGTAAGEFVYDGVGCTEITTPVATTTP